MILQSQLYSGYITAAAFYVLVTRLTIDLSPVGVTASGGVRRVVIIGMSSGVEALQLLRHEFEPSVHDSLLGVPVYVVPDGPGWG